MPTAHTRSPDAGHPSAFGVFKPVGHVVVAFPSEGDLDAAATDLSHAGFHDADVVRYTPEQMKAQVEYDLAHASPLAAVGQELNLIKAHRELAEQGHGFLVVLAPKDEQTETVARIARAHHAARAQKYGRFMIQELVEPGSGERQVFESPDRGLDPQTPDGDEGRPARH